MIFYNTLRLIPFALVDGNHLSGMTGNSSVRKKVGWICKDHVNAVFPCPIQYLDAIALKKSDGIFRIVVINSKRRLVSVVGRSLGNIKFKRVHCEVIANRIFVLDSRFWPGFLLYFLC